MSNTVNSIFDQTLELSAIERAIIAEKLLFSLGNPNPKIDDIWAKEAKLTLYLVTKSLLGIIKCESSRGRVR